MIVRGACMALESSLSLQRVPVRSTLIVPFWSSENPAALDHGIVVTISFPASGLDHLQVIYFL